VGAASGGSLRSAEVGAVAAGGLSSVEVGATSAGHLRSAEVGAPSAGDAKSAVLEVPSGPVVDSGKVELPNEAMVSSIGLSCVLVGASLESAVSVGGVTSFDVMATVRFGSKDGGSGLNRPPSMVQNF